MKTSLKFKMFQKRPLLRMIVVVVCEKDKVEKLERLPRLDNCKNRYQPRGN